MKKDIHPQAYTTAKVHCNSCKAEFEVLSTLEKFDVEVCSNCHPFYTGDQRIMDTAGRAEKFRARMAKAEGAPKKEKKERSSNSDEVTSTEN